MRKTPKEHMRIVRLKPGADAELPPDTAEEFRTAPVIYELAPANRSGLVFIGTTPDGGNVAAFVPRSCLEYDG